MGQSRDLDVIGNYHFFERENRSLVYDFVNNILYRPKKKTDYFLLREFIEQYSRGEITLEDCIEHRFRLFIENFQSDKETFDSMKHFDEISTISSKITLMVSQSCNLKCAYCYGHDGKFGSSTGGFMSEEIGENAMRFAVDRARKNGMKFIFVTFFGGEPLLNFSLMKHIVEFNNNSFPDISFSYSTTTNLTLITQSIAEFIREHNISILVSLDGFKEVHDKNRVFKNGRGSYDAVMRGINILKKNKLSFSVRSTLPHEYYRSYEHIINHFEELGAQNIYISRLCNYNDDVVDVFDANMEELAEEFSILNEFHDRTHERILKGEKPSHVPYTTMFERIHEADKSLISCGVFKGSTTVSINGDLYPCHRFVGMTGFCFGNIKDGVNINILNKLVKTMDETTRKCWKCWARYLCKRGCARDIAKNGGKFVDYTNEYCNLIKVSIEKALVAYYNIVIVRPSYIKEFSHKEIEVYNVI